MVQVAEQMKTENVAAVSHALLHKKRKIFAAEMYFFQALNREKNLKKKRSGSIWYGSVR